MKRKAVILSLVVVLSTMVAGVGASATTAPGPAQQAPVSAQQTTPQTNDSTTSQVETGQPAPPEAGDPPYPIDIPPSQLRNGTVDLSTLPETIRSNGEYAVGTNVGYVTRSKTDAERRPSPEYEVGGPTLLWPSLDATAQSGPENSSRYYFKGYTLKVVSPSVEIWVANDLSYPEGDSRPTPEITQAQLLYLADEFTNNIEPKESQLYRDPIRQYGVNSPLYGPTGPNGTLPDDYYQSADNQSRTVLLVDNVRDTSYYDPSVPTYIAGFFSPTIGTLTDRNVMVIDSNEWQDRLGGPDAPWKQDEGDAEDESAFGIESTTAHEYQHLLHSYEDPGETTWINEGLAEVTPYRVGYGIPGSIEWYERFPSNSLIEWEDQRDEAPISILADYGAAGLFQLYGSQQFGIEFTKNVFEADSNGMQSIKDALDKAGAERDFYSFYQDFQTALVTDGLTTATDRYQIDDLQFDANTDGTVVYQGQTLYVRGNQTSAYGNAFNELDVPEGQTIGDLSVTGIQFPPTTWTTAPDPTNASNETVLWSTSGNGLNNWLIFDADLAGTENPTLNFETYYDIEDGWDYGFVQISTDGGQTWTSLENQNTTDFTASPFVRQEVVENLPGFTGDTNGTWVTESFDLSAYAGQDVLIAFRYVTDGALVRPGFYVRDISVSGTDISYDGSSTEPFQSLRSATNNYIEYMYSFVGIRADGSTEVVQLPRKTFEGGSPMTLSQVPTGEFEQTIFAVTWAPEMPDTGTVPYGYAVNSAETVSQCRVIDQPGSYTLTQDIVVANPDSSCIEITASDVTFDGNGHTISVGAGATNPNVDDNAAISVAGDTILSNVTVRDVTVQNFDFGIGFSGVGSGAITGVTAEQNNVGILVRNSGRVVQGFAGGPSQIEVSGNTLSDNAVEGGPGGAAIVLSNSEGIEVSDNEAMNNNIGVFLTQSTNNEIIGNDIAGSAEDGISLFSGSNNNLIANNEVSTSVNNGIILDSSNGNKIVNNTVFDNTDDGLNLGNADNNVILNNVFSHNGYGDDGEDRNGITITEDTPDATNDDLSNNNTIAHNVINESAGVGILMNGENTENLIYDNKLVNAENVAFVQGGADANNQWNVEPRDETNVIGGDTTAGNYYAHPGDAQGYSEMCADDAAEFGICDEPLDLDGDGSDDNTDFYPLTVELGELEITPNPVEFGAVETDETETRTITFSNVGNDTITVDPEDSLDSDVFSIVSGDTSARTLAPGESFELTVEFAPATEADDQRAELDVESTDSDEPETAVVLIGDGAPAGMGDLDAPANAMFGDVIVGDTKTQTVTVENEGTDPVTVNETSVSGADAGEFSVVSGGAGDGTFTLAPGETRDLTVQFAPGSAGEKSATLTVDTTNDGTETVALTGTGVQPETSTITFEGTGSYATYEFTVSGEVIDGNGLTAEDSFSGNHGEGAIRAGQDSFVFTGTLEDFTTTGDVIVKLNGEVIQQPQNTLRIEGTGDYAFYSFRASGDVNGEGLSAEDTVKGSTASGAVGAGSDTYTFEGDLENLYVQGDARVFLNGEEINPDSYESTLTIAGDGSYTAYSFTVMNGDIIGSQGLTGEDSVRGDHAEGAVRAGSETYTVTGVFQSFDLDGDATVVLNGQEVDPSLFYNTITFEGTGSYASYEFSVTDEVIGGIGLTPEDSFSGDDGEGAIRAGQDSFVYAGTLDALTTDGNVVVTVNGEEIQEDDT